MKNQRQALTINFSIISLNSAPRRPKDGGKRRLSAIMNKETSLQPSNLSSLLGWREVLLCWGVAAVKIIAPFLAGRLLLSYYDVSDTDISSVLKIRVALIPLEQWLSAVVVAVVVYLIQRVRKRCSFRGLLMAVLGWLPLIIACCFILHEWFIQYRGIIEIIGVQPHNAVEFLSPLVP